MRSLLAASGALCLSLAFCHEPEQPPLAPPTPTDPSNGGRRIVAIAPPDEVLDASIVSDAGPALDVPIFGLDAGIPTLR
jgi:hypothetical protein